ncbi:MAG: transcriptional repressor [Treponemataceae bacterium]
MTKAREAALSALRKADQPLSASGVCDAITLDCDQATVYRALHYLEEKGLTESFILHCDEHGTERYYVPSGAPHSHWFHCEACHRFIDLGACRIGDLTAAVEREKELSVRRHVLYFTGLCGECGGRGTSNG